MINYIVPGKTKKKNGDSPNIIIALQHSLMCLQNYDRYDRNENFYLENLHRLENLCLAISPCSSLVSHLPDSNYRCLS